MSKKCPICLSEKQVKDGIIKNRQRYLCKQCHYRGTVSSRGMSAAIKKQALHLYLEGLGFRQIGRILGCSHVSVYNWIKKYGHQISSLSSEQSSMVIEIDEIHTFVGVKKQLLDLDCGRSTREAIH